MNEKEVSELRRRFKPERSSVTHIRGCYVNENQEIVSQFDQHVALMPEDEVEKFLALLKKTLSGTLGGNLVDLEFTTEQVVQSEEHKLLMALRDTALKDDEAVQAFYERAIPTIYLEENYLILLAHDSYDVPYRTTDGFEQEDASSTMYSYLVCAVCPVKLSKPALSYYAHENEFHSRAADWLVSSPELGFLFPAFDERAANIYGAEKYTRDRAENHEEFVTAVFGTAAPMPADAQKETFQALLCDTFAEDCDFETVQGVRNQLQGMIDLHKENREEEPLTISKGAVRQLMEANGASETQMAAFDERYDTDFGEQAVLSPRNIVDKRQLELVTAEVSIRVAPGRDDVVQTRVIDGARYILIRADEGVEVNGIPIHIT